MINEDVRYIVEAELQPGEELLWADKPAQRPLTVWGVWGGGAWLFAAVSSFFWILSIILIDEPVPLLRKLIFIAFGVCFFLVLMALRKQPLKHLLGPAREVYGLTNRRAIIISPYWRMEKVNITPSQMQKTRVQENDNIGNLIFADVKVPVFVMAGSKKYWDAADLWQKSELSTFHKIPNPRDVEKLIRMTFFSEEQGDFP